MATFYKRAGARGIRWTARVRIAGREATKTFATKSAAKGWARAQEGAIETGSYKPTDSRSGRIFADLIDDFLEHRTRTLKRPPGKTFALALARLKLDYGLEPVAALTHEFWLRHAHKRTRGGAQGQTVASELAHAGSVLRHAARSRIPVDVTGPRQAREDLRQEGVRVVSRQRKRRVTDTEIDALLAWVDANKARTSLPLRDLIEFALATGMRRGEILALRWTEIDGRVAKVKRKHPTERDRVEDVPLLKPHADWPTVDPLDIIQRQAKRGPRIFPYVGDTLGFWFEEACKGAGIDGVVFHQLRHECLSRLAKRGFDPLRLALVGGHRDLRNVKRYANLAADELANE